MLKEVSLRPLWNYTDTMKSGIKTPTINIVSKKKRMKKKI